MNETRRKPTTGRQSPSLVDKWHGIFYMPSRIDEAGHTKAFGYPVADHWWESRNVQFHGWDLNQQHISPESNTLPTEPPRSPRGSHNPGSSTGGIFSQLGGELVKNSPATRRPSPWSLFIFSDKLIELLHELLDWVYLAAPQAVLYFSIVKCLGEISHETYRYGYRYIYGYR